MSQYQPYNQRGQQGQGVPQNEGTQGRGPTVITNQANLGTYLYCNLVEISKLKQFKKQSFNGPVLETGEEI